MNLNRIMAAIGMLLTATGTGSTLTIDADGDTEEDYTGVPGETFQSQYWTAGTFIAHAWIGGTSVGTMTVTVVDVNLNGPIPCQIAYTREKEATVIPAAATSSVTFTGSGTSLLGVSVKETTNTGKVLYLTPRAAQPSDMQDQPTLVARLGGATGPIIARQLVDAFTFTYPTELDYGMTFDDGTVLGTARVVMTPLVSDPNIVLNLLMTSGPATFEGGVTSFSINATDFLLSSDGTCGVDCFLVFIPPTFEDGSLSMGLYDLDPAKMGNDGILHFSGTHGIINPYCLYTVLTSADDPTAPRPPFAVGCATKYGAGTVLCINSCDVNTTTGARACNPITHNVNATVTIVIFDKATSTTYRCQMSFNQAVGGVNGAGNPVSSTCQGVCTGGSVLVILTDI